MANLPPGDPKLVSLIVNHLKSQGLFDQFRKDCLADVDTKPAYQNLRQRVDNFVSNHLASHTWSPHLNKNQLRNNIRQQVLKSGMLGAGIDRIISQVVDPKINHTFRPQVEKVVQEFLATLNNKEDTNANYERTEEKPESSVSVTGSTSVVGPSTSVANDAMSILETISSLNQEATTAWALTDNPNHKTNDKVSRKLLSQLSVDVTGEKDGGVEEMQENDRPIQEISNEGAKPTVKQEELNDILAPTLTEDVKNATSETIVLAQGKDTLNDGDEKKAKVPERTEKRIEVIEKSERKEEKKETRAEKRTEYTKKIDDNTRQKEEKPTKERDAETEPVKHPVPEKISKQKTAEYIKEECTSLDSDVDAYSDVTVSSVHTSDLSSFEEEESEEEDAVSDSTEEGEITSDDEDKAATESKAKSEQSEPRTKGTRHAYVHKPYLYSKYYSDSDDELTVEQRRQSVAKEKEERLLRRQVKRERLEEKRQQRAAEKSKALKMKSQGMTSAAPKSSKGQKPKSSSIKEVLKEQMFLEKKVAMSKKKKRDMRPSTSTLRIKSDYLDEDSRDTQKSSESQERASSSTRDSRSSSGRSDSKLSRNFLETTDESKSESRIEREFKKKPSSFIERTQDNDTSDTRKHLERLDFTSEEQQKHRTSTKNEKHSKKEANDSDLKNLVRKDLKSHRNDRERTYSEERSSSKHRHKTDSSHKQGCSDLESPRSKRSSKDDNLHKHSQSKSSSEERSDRKSKQKSEGKSSSSSKEDRTSDHSSKTDDSVKDRHRSTEKSRSENRYKRSSSDSKHRDSQSSSRPHSSSQKVSKTLADDKNEADSANSDNSRQDDNVHKNKRRTHSCSEERAPTKSKLKSSSKSSKQNDQEETNKKSEKDKVVVEGSTDKYRKSKSEDRDGEDKRDSSVTPISSSVAKETSHKSKYALDKVKERSRHDSRDLGSSKQDKKYSGEKSANMKHSHKDVKRKSDGSKSEEKSEYKSKHPDDKRKQERSNTSEWKSSKKFSSEYRGESSKGAITKKVSKSESDAQLSSDSKDSERSRENKNAGKMLEVTEKTTSEATVAECPSASNLDNVIAPSVTETATSSKTSAQKSKTKQGVSDSKDNKSTGAFKPTSKTSLLIDTDNNKDSDLAEASFTHKVAYNKMDMPNTQSAIDVPKEMVLEIPPNESRNPESSDRERSQSSVLERSYQDRSDSAIELHNIEPSNLSPNDIYSEVTDSNDGEISTSDLAEEDANSTKEAIKKESAAILVPVDLSELDNLVTGNDVDGEASAMETETSQAEYNDERSATHDGFGVEEDFSVNVTCTERNVGSSIMEIHQGGSSMYSVNDQTGKELECEDTATSSSSVVKNSNDDVRHSGEDTATSSNTLMDNRTDKSHPERDTVNFDNSREYTSSASADGNFVEDDGDFTMLSENSFEDATTSSSSDRKHCNQEHFLDPMLSSVKNTEAAATCSQSTSDVAPERIGNITLKAATSSSANRGSSESAQDNAASSSYSAEENVLTLGVSNNVTHTATSSDTPAQSVASETAVAHVATSSESYGTLHVSEHITTHAATSSSTAAESDGLGTSERHTATSSSNVINSSREVNFEVSLVSSEVDGENTAASSSYVMDCNLADSNENPLERESDNAASSSSSVPSRSKHNFNNVEDSKNTRATSSTQQDGANDTCIDVISSGTLKEYPGNSSDLAMDSSTEVSVSVGKNINFSGSAPSCSSSGRGQSPENNKYVEQRKEKDNTASSSSGHPLVLSPTVGDEAASSSSSFRKSSIQRRLEATLNSENTEATASSSIAMDSRSERFDRSSPGNSTDTTATSSSNSTNSCANVNHNTQPTASSSVAMDSSSEEDLNIRCETDIGNNTNSATSSGSLERVCEEQSVRNDGVPASSSTMVADRTKEIVYADKVSEQTATSSNMMDSSIEDDKACDVVSNNNVYATTSTTIRLDCEDAKDTGDLNTSSDVNSEATAATSSNTMEGLLDNRDDNASSSDYMMDSSLEGMLQASGPTKNEEAASSSSFTDGGVQENRMEATVERPIVDDATTSSSTERENDLVVSDLDDALNNETSSRTIEMAAESSFISNHRNSVITGTSEEACLLNIGADANDEHECVERDSEDGVNDLIYDKTEEKEDAVSSASSEEQRHVTVSRPDMRQLGDGETDGVVTSAGTEARVSPITSEKSEASAHVSCVDKGIHTDVSNITAHHPVEELAVSHTSGIDNNEGQMSEISVDNQVPADPERDASVENVVFEIIADVGTVNEAPRPTNQPLLEEGEGAVTSTGISEENDGGKGVIRRQNDSACFSTESHESAIETRDSRAITEDDESAITSTGAKEDEEEGEGFVTSSGTAGEDPTFSISVEHNSTSVIHTVEKNSDDMAMNPEEQTNDQEVEETFTGEIPENITSFTVTPEILLNSTLDTRANEYTPCVSVESITLCDATASGSWVQSSKEKLDSSEQGNILDCVAELDNVSEVPQVSENSGMITVSLDDRITNSEEPPPLPDVECSSQSVEQISSEDNVVSSEETLEDNKAQSAFIDNTETAPTAVMDKPIVLETSHECEDSLLNPDLQTISNSMILCPDKSTSELEETSGPSEASQEKSTVEPAEETLNTTSIEVPGDSAIPPSDHVPLIDCSPLETEPHVQSLDDKDESLSIDKKTSKKDENLQKPEDVEPVNKPEEDKVVMKEKLEEIPSSIKPVEEPKVEPEKRKRGRPRKRPLSETESSKKQSSGVGLPLEGPKHTENRGKSKDGEVAKTETEKKKSETENSESNPEPVRRRGRKRKSSPEKGSSEQDKKRKKSESNEEEQGEEEEQEDSENDDDEDDIHKGATTRAASRLEAQRKLPHKPTTRAASKLSSPEKSSPGRRGKVKSPDSKAGKSTKNKAATPQASGTKRRRDSSQNASEETPTKRIKRQ